MLIPFMSEMSASVLQEILGSLAQDLACGICRESVLARVKDVVIKWTLTQVRDIVLKAKCH